MFHMCTTCPAHLILLGFIKPVFHAELIMQFSEASHHFIPLGSKYSTQNPVLKTLNKSCSLNVKDEVSQQYKTTDKTTVPHI
jgi:hypothetical protein